MENWEAGKLENRESGKLESGTFLTGIRDDSFSSKTGKGTVPDSSFPFSPMSPEEAYVRSKDLLEKGISEDIAMREKVKYYQSKGLFISMAIGTFLALITQNPASFFIPIILVNVKVLPLSMKVLKALRLSLEEQKRDLEKLIAGDLNPVDYYESRRKRLTEMGKARVLDSLSSDTSKLSYDEREMLTKFSGPKACG